MYLVIRCPSCFTFTYVDQYQRWKLCPVCGESIAVNHAQAYIDVHDHRDADLIAHELESYLDEAGKNDLSQSEKRKLISEYVRQMREAQL